MRLANPISDRIFNYLLEDTSIAKGLIGKIIGEEIVELDLQAKEIEGKFPDYLVILLCIDFKAILKLKDGTYKKVLIEIQKGKDDQDVLRFRRYLSANYRTRDKVKLDNGEVEELDLPIISIYFLGFRLKQLKTPVIKVNRHYTDLVTDQILTEKDDFIEKLTHDGYFIQIPRLHKRERNELEGILKVFNQSYRSDDNRLLEISEAELKRYPLLEQIGNRLLRAASDEELLSQMDFEEEVEERIEKHLRENAVLREKNKTLNEDLVSQKKISKEKDKTLEEKNKALEAKDKTLQKQQEVLQEKDKALQDQKYLNAKNLLAYSSLSDEAIAQLVGITTEEIERIHLELEE